MDGEAMKAKENEFFKAEKYSEAITCYSQAIEINPSESSYYGIALPVISPLKTTKQR